MKNIAIFDFDETLVKENSLSYLFKFFLGKKPLFIYLLPILFDYRIYTGTIRKVIKQRLYKLSLNKRNISQVFEAGIYTANKLTPIHSVLERLKQLHQESNEIWIITASPQSFIEGIIHELKWPVEHVIGTLLEDEDKVLNGLIGEECQKEEKVIRFNVEVKKENTTISVKEAYGNLPVDIPMLELAENRFCVKNGELFPYN